MLGARACNSVWYRDRHGLRNSVAVPGNGTPFYIQEALDSALREGRREAVQLGARVGTSAPWGGHIG